MKLLSFIMTATLVAGSAAHAAEPTFTFESNQDQSSYHFTLQNETKDKISCALIEVSATVGSADCSDVRATYKFAIKNKILNPSSKIENSSFGIDYLANKRKIDKNRDLIFCGQPEVKFTCL